MKVQYPFTTNFPVKFKHTEEEKIIPDTVNLSKNLGLLKSLMLEESLLLPLDKYNY